MVSHDLWPRRFLERREKKKPDLPARVFWPETIDEVVRIIRAAIQENIAVVPFGAGSGVCAGIAVKPQTWVLDTKRMDQLLEINQAEMTCTVEAGMIGERLERALNAQGYSLGHFPSSIYCSTVGGWVATRSAGQLSSRYGKIEDLVLGVEAVDGSGAILNASYDDPQTGPAALRLLIGSEAALCVFTKITFRIHRPTEFRWLRGYQFKNLDCALEGMQFILKSGVTPSVLRLYDPLDTFLAGVPDSDELTPHAPERGSISLAGLEYSGPNAGRHEPGVLDALTEHLQRMFLFAKPDQTQRVVGNLLSRPLMVNMALNKLAGGTKLIIGLEGDAGELEHRIKHADICLTKTGGTDVGERVGQKWLKNRHRVSYRMSHVFAAGGWADTMEVATGWDQVLPLYEEVCHALRDVAIVMCHFSHAYIDGCSLYFTFSGGGGRGQGKRSSLQRYDLAWQRALAVVKKFDAALSHHHGIGRSKKNAIQLSAPSLDYLLTLKKIFDPHGILNPGVLGLGDEP